LDLTIKFLFLIEGLRPKNKSTKHYGDGENPLHLAKGEGHIVGTVQKQVELEHQED